MGILPAHATSPSSQSGAASVALCAPNAIKCCGLVHISIIVGLASAFSVYSVGICSLDFSFQTCRLQERPCQLLQTTTLMIFALPGLHASSRDSTARLLCTRCFTVHEPTLLGLETFFLSCFGISPGLLPANAPPGIIKFGPHCCLSSCPPLSLASPPRLTVTRAIQQPRKFDVDSNLLSGANGSSSLMTTLSVVASLRIVTVCLVLRALPRSTRWLFTEPLARRLLATASAQQSKFLVGLGNHLHVEPPLRLCSAYLLIQGITFRTIVPSLAPLLIKNMSPLCHYAA